MGSAGFVHLHTHTEFSLLDGACKIKDMVKQAQTFEMPAIALTDHGVMFGIIGFYEACQAAGIKPILGCEVYVAPRRMTDRDPKKDNKQYHLVLLAENEKGYKNLLKLCSAGWTDGFYYKPRVDKDILSRHSEGLIALTACLGGEVPEMITAGDYDRAVKSFCEYREIFGKDNIYIELQDHDLKEQKPVNEALVKMAGELGVKLVCTNDSHYLTRKDASAHDVLLCIQTGTTIDDPKRFRFGSNEFYVKSEEEMRKRFGQYPGALENTLEIAERCNVELDFSRSQMPRPEIPEGMTDDEYLEHLAWEGMNWRYPNPTEEIKDRIRMELDVIKKMGYPQYFLIVRDFAQFARKQGICIGVRGSAAGSIVGHCLGITDVDPIEFALPFERFLNIERVSMPDIDMDFQDDRRDEVIKYVTEKYGADHVSQIITFGTLAARAAVRDCGRALGMPPAEVDRVCKMIPTIPVGISIDRAMTDNPDLKQAYDRDPQIRKLIDTAKQLEGISRHSSTHAAGIIISGDPLTETCPVIKGSKGEIISQFDAHGLEMVGLLKMDFLGLRNLTTLSRAIQNIKEQQGIEIDHLALPDGDEKTFEMLGQGDTTGVFQLESVGMRRYIQELKPNSIKELAAMIALYRPGPMANIPKYIKCKLGQEKITYLHPCLEPILKDSYGVVVYQDDVMYIARAVAGFTLGQADILRRAMGKKKKEEMEKMRAKFFEGAEKNNIPRKTAEAIFDLIEPFAGYGFNKAHAVCYAHVAYQTAYLKANYPIEYMAALLATNVESRDKVAQYIEECRKLNIEVLPPDVNESEADFSVQKGAIRFGLAAIKNCGRGLVDTIIAERKANGPFKSLQDFCERLIGQGGVGKSTVEFLIRAGAFGSILPNRAQLLAALDEAISRAQTAQKDRVSGQEALFGGMDELDSVTEMDMSKYSHIGEYAKAELLAMERDLLGLYVTDHPLNHVREVLEKSVTHNSETISELEDQAECTIGGIITEVKHHLTRRNNEKMAFIKIEDMRGTINVTVFPFVYKNCEADLVQDSVVLIKGKASHRDRIAARSDSEDERSYDVEITCDSVTPIKNTFSTTMIKNGNGNGNGNGKKLVHIKLDHRSRPVLDILKSMIECYPGANPVIFHVQQGSKSSKVATNYKVDASPKFVEEAQRILGGDVIWMEG